MTAGIKMFVLSVDVTCFVSKHGPKETFFILLTAIKCIFLHNSILQILDKINVKI